MIVSRQFNYNIPERGYSCFYNKKARKIRVCGVSQTPNNFEGMKGKFMSESYVEILVKKEKTMVDSLLRGVAIALTVITLLLGLTGNLIILAAGIALAVGTYLIWLNTDVEYEYLYLDKEITVDKIMARTKRKRAATFELERMEILAPANSHRLDSYRNRDMKELDFSSRKKEQTDKRLVMVYNDNQRIYFENSEELANVIKNVAPRKVFLD